MSESTLYRTHGGSITPLFKYGRNNDIDQNQTEDVWTVGGDYPFPATATTVTIESTSGGDAPDGSGAATVTVVWQKTDYTETETTIALSGTSAVAFTSSLFRSHRGWVETRGSAASASAMNIGDINLKQGTATILQIPAAKGKTLMTVWTVPAGFRRFELLSWGASIGKSIASVVEFELWARESGGVWRVQDSIEINNTGNSYRQSYDEGLVWPVGTDFKLRATSSANNVKVTGNFFGRLYT